MGPRQMSVCFSGYRPEKLPWGENESDPRCAALKKRLYDAAESACAQGYRHFICGMARGVDLYACEAEGWPEAERARWQSLVDRCDYETVVQDHYDAGCMQRRNRYMVDHAALLIAVHDGQPGGTRRTIEYAMRRRLDVVILPPVENEKET